jgi:ubiquitin C-terminal hydrolase
MNSIPQIFNNIKKFGDDLYYRNLENYNCPITKALQKVIINLRNPNKYYFIPTEFYYIISNYNNKFLKNSPNDSRQLIQFILESVHNELNENKDKNYPFEDNSKNAK